MDRPIEVCDALARLACSAVEAGSGRAWIITDYINELERRVKMLEDTRLRRAVKTLNGTTIHMGVKWVVESEE